MRRALTGSGSDDAAISKRRWMADETLLTFCPPAPCARTAVQVTSFSAIGFFIATLRDYRLALAGKPPEKRRRDRCKASTECSISATRATGGRDPPRAVPPRARRRAAG